MKMIHTEILNLINKKTLGLTFVLSAAAFAFAQEKQEFTGKIVDKQNNPIPYASVTFENKTVKENKALFSDATLTDDKGKYAVKLVPGTYEITVEAIDFKKYVTTKVITNNFNLGNIQIETEQQVTNNKTKEIEGVTLTVTAKPYKVELDKKTYDVSTDLISKGGNLQDVLSNVPSVEVDTDGTVSMRGSSNVKFLINGKPSALLGIDDGANALQSIPADQIEKIEVITNPSSKFEASGTSGILNIILKKSKKIGFNGSVTGSLGYQPRTSLNTNLSWRRNAWTWFLNGGGGYTESTGKSNNDVFYKNQNIANQLLESHQKGENNNTMKNYNASTGFVYDINDKTSVNASVTVRGFNGETNSTNSYDYLYNSTILANPFTDRISDGTNKNLALQGDFGLDKKLDNNGQNISFSLSLQRNKSDNKTDISQTSDNIFDSKFIADTQNPSMSYLFNDITQNTVNKSLIGKIDYELPIGKQSKLEAGYRIDNNNNNYEYAVLEKIGENNPFVTVPNYTNNTIYKEMFNAVYVQYKSKLGNLGYQLGLRDELSNINIDYTNYTSPSKSFVKDKNYNNLFPSVYLSYDLGKDNQFLLNYSKRIDRPRSWFMVPFMSYNDNQNFFLGNTDLNPSYVDSFEFGYSIQKKKFTLNPTLYYRKTNDDTKIISYQEDERTNISYSMPINLGTDERYGLDFNGTADINSWWKIMASINLFGYKTLGNYTYNTIDQYGNNITRNLDYSGDGFSTRMRLSNTFKVDKTFSMQLQGFYRGGQKTVAQDQKAMYAVNFGATKTIWNGNGTLAFNIQDIFNTRSREVTNIRPTSTSYSYMQWMPRQFSISLTYRFKQGEKVDQPKRKKDINNNESGGDDQMPPM